MGGGEGYWARYLKETFPESEVFLCDLSFNTLRKVPDFLGRVCADVSERIFEEESLSLICFWVKNAK